MGLSGGLLLQAQQKPNIIVILADDMGFSDLGCFGSEIHTPNLDRLAANGLRFTQFYNAARCCPTRASLLTGLQPHQAGMGHMAGGNENMGTPAYEGYLNRQCVTIAEALKPAGYFTAHSGKWHVGAKTPAMKPNGRGFDISIDGQGFYFGGDTKGKGPEFNGKTMTDLDNSWYSTSKYAEYGVKFIQQAQEAKQPFFLYLAFNAPHWPLQAPDSVIAKYLGKYKQGWAAMRETRFAKQKALGLFGKDVKLSPADSRITSWESLSDAEKTTQDSIMATYAACVDMLDQGVGKVVAHLKATGQLDNTLIMFLSDNGGCAEGPATGLGNNSGKGKIGSPGSFVRCAQSWANLECTPYREYKHYTHEGGIHTSFIAHWPKGFTAKGEFRNEPGHIIDIMPTCLAAAGAAYPQTFKGRNIIPMAGVSLIPAFKGFGLNRDTLCWEHEANRGIRIKNIKLVSRANPKLTFSAATRYNWELYDLNADPTELNNLASVQPKIVKQMAAEWENWAKRASVLPSPWGDIYGNAKADSAAKKGKKKQKQITEE